jgi:hypothetical protein
VEKRLELIGCCCCCCCALDGLTDEERLAFGGEFAGDPPYDALKGDVPIVLLLSVEDIPPPEDDDGGGTFEPLDPSDVTEEKDPLR